MEAIIIIFSIPFIISGFSSAWDFFGGFDYFTQPGAFVLALRIALCLIIGCTIGYFWGVIKAFLWIVQIACKFVMSMF